MLFSPFKEELCSELPKSASSFAFLLGGGVLAKYLNNVFAAPILLRLDIISNCFHNKKMNDQLVFGAKSREIRM